MGFGEVDGIWWENLENFRVWRSKTDRLKVPVYYVRVSQSKMSKLVNFLMNIRRFYNTHMNHKGGKKLEGNKSFAEESTLNDQCRAWVWTVVLSEVDILQGPQPGRRRAVLMVLIWQQWKWSRYFVQLINRCVCPHPPHMLAGHFSC